jgi:putative membrane protein
MTSIIVRWLITTVTILMIPHVISGVRVSGLASALVAAAILGVLNTMVRPVLIILTLPLTILTLGVFILVINALMFELAGSIVPGFEVDSFWHALLGSLIVSLVSWAANLTVADGPQEQITIIRRGRGPTELRPTQDKNVVDLRPGDRGTWE